MPLFPELGPQYYTERHRGILSRMEAAYAESVSMNQAFWQEADTDLRYYSGDQSLWNQLYYGNVPMNNRRNMTFNRIRRVISMIEGYQRRNRKSTIVIPVENSDDITADQFTKVMMWINQQENVLETISDAFQGALVTGMSLLQVWLDYRDDPVSGNIRVDNCSYNSFLIDPFFKKRDLSDCNYLWKRSFLNKREILSLLPDKEDEIMGLDAPQQNNRDGKFQFMPEQYSWSITNLLTYDEYYYRDYRTQTMLVDTKTGETMEWRTGSEESLREFLYYYPEVTKITQEIPTVNLAIVVQGKVIYDGPNPLGTDQYNFIPVLCYYHPELPYFDYRIQGVVRGLRDAQYLYNRRRIIELDILESQINSGWIYKENALVNPKDVFLSGQGRGLALKEDAQMTDVLKIEPGQIPPSMIQLSELLAREVMEISGVNEELLGSAIDEKAGILSMLRQGAGLTTLQNIFDQLDTSQRLLGKLILDIVQTNFTPGKIKRIIGDEPSPQFHSKAFGKYHAMVEEGLNTTSQKQMQFAQLIQLRESGVPIPNESLLEAATIQDKKKITDLIKAQEQQQAQMAQQQAQQQQEQLQAQTQMMYARAKADEGLGIERQSRVQENQALAVERQAQAIKDQDSGVLDLIKAIKEIQSIDLENVEKALGIVTALKEKQQQELRQPQSMNSMMQAQRPF